MTNEELCILAQSGNAEAETKLIQKILPHVKKHVAKIENKVKNNNPSLRIEKEDLIQEASIGLLKAIKTFKPEMGVLFTTYAYSVYINAARDYVRRSKNLFPTDVIIYSLDGSPSDDEDLDAESYYYNRFLFQYVKTPEQILIEKETYEEIHHALDMISNRESVYLRYRYGFDDGLEHDLGMTASHFHLSQNRAKKLEQLALDNVKLELPWWYDL